MPGPQRKGSSYNIMNMLVSGRFSWKCSRSYWIIPKTWRYWEGMPLDSGLCSRSKSCLDGIEKMKKVLDHLIGLDSNPTTISNKNWDPRHSADIYAYIYICAYHMYIPDDMNNSPVFFFLLVIDKLYCWWYLGMWIIQVYKPKYMPNACRPWKMSTSFSKANEDFPHENLWTFGFQP